MLAPIPYMPARFGTLDSYRLAFAGYRKLYCSCFSRKGASSMLFQPGEDTVNTSRSAGDT